MKIDDAPDSSYNPPQHSIVWNYEYQEQNLATTDAWMNLKRPSFLHQDPQDSSRMFLIGRYYGKGSVMKFNKNSFAIDWRTSFTISDTVSNHIANGYSNPKDAWDSSIHDIVSYVQPPF